MRMLGAMFLAVLALALVAAGCGSSGSSGSATGNTTTVETTADETVATDTTDTTEVDTTSDDTTTTDETIATDETQTTSSTVDEDALANLLGSEECASLVGLSAQLAAALGAGGDSSSGFEETERLFDELAEKAPEDIRDDFAVMADAWRAIVKAYEEIGLEPGATPSDETVQKFQELGEKLEKELGDSKFEEASSNISAWVEKNCSANG